MLSSTFVCLWGCSITYVGIAGLGEVCLVVLVPSPAASAPCGCLSAVGFEPGMVHVAA